MRRGAENEIEKTNVIAAVGLELLPLPLRSLVSNCEFLLHSKAQAYTAFHSIVAALIGSHLNSLIGSLTRPRSVCDGGSRADLDGLAQVLQSLLQFLKVEAKRCFHGVF